MSDNMRRDALIAEARRAREDAYAPYSGLSIGATLAFADGTLVTGANVENASYGLSVCAETAAVVKAMGEGHRGGLEAVVIYADTPKPISPCGRCRQVLNELAALGDTDPIVWCANDGDVTQARLSHLLPHAFGPDSLRQT
ncbi:MAG: cytidine deaminase [Novosphingobium sp.]